MSQVLVTPQASDDLDGIWDYIARDSVRAADNWLDQLWMRLRLLADNPELGELQPLLAAGNYRRHVVGNYVIYYEPQADGIAVIRVLHAARDQQRQF